MAAVAIAVTDAVVDHRGPVPHFLVTLTSAVYMPSEPAMQHMYSFLSRDGCLKGSRVNVPAATI